MNSEIMADAVAARCAGLGSRSYFLGRSSGRTGAADASSRDSIHASAAVPTPNVADDGRIVMELLLLLSHCAASGIGPASTAGPSGDFDDVDGR